jgi:hypothetical protein
VELRIKIVNLEKSAEVEGWPFILPTRVGSTSFGDNTNSGVPELVISQSRVSRMTVCVCLSVVSPHMERNTIQA